MAKNPKILSIVLAGGEGTRLMPLTRDRAKPAVPFGGVYRLIDFPLSNLVNSGYRQVVVLTQYKSHSLDRHISTVWRFSPLLGNYVSPVPAQQRLGKHWYLGSADAIYQTINIIEDVQPDIVVIVGADHVYRMDFQQMVQQHIESGAEFTVAGIRQPISQSNQFGVIEVDPEHPNMIKSFQEKPQTTTGLPDDPNSILASMGNYVANTDALFEALALDEKAEDTKHDMGGDIAPYFAARNEAGVYDFNSNEIPGATPTDHAYWRDVGTLKQFYDAHMDLIAYVPEFNLYEEYWKIYTKSEIQPPDYIAGDSVVERSIIGEGSDIYGEVYNSVIGCGVTIGKGTVIRDSIIMNQTQIGEGCEINKAIIAENVVVGNQVKLGVGEETENDTAPHIYNHGLVTIGEKSVIPDGISVGKNSVISGVTAAADYEDSQLASGKTLIKAGE